MITLPRGPRFAFDGLTEAIASEFTTSGMIRLPVSVKLVGFCLKFYVTISVDRIDKTHQSGVTYIHIEQAPFSLTNFQDTRHAWMRKDGVF